MANSFTPNRNLEKADGDSVIHEPQNENQDLLDKGLLIPVSEWGEDVSEFDPVCIKQADDLWYKADGNDDALAVCMGLAFDDYSSGSAGFAYAIGCIADVTGESWTRNALIFVDDSKALSQTAGTKIVIAGWPLTDTKMIVGCNPLWLQLSHIADPTETAATLTDNSGGGAADNTIGAITVAITDPGDAPADADALRDDLVTNTIPDIEQGLQDCADAIAELADEINKLITDRCSTNTAVDAILARLEAIGTSADS